MSCIYYNCGNTKHSSKGSNVKFFQFPPIPYMRQKWIEACNIGYGLLPKNPLVCSVHFRQEDINIKNNYTRLSLNAIPLQSVPEDTRRREKWSKVCQKEFSKNSRICIDHFSKADIITTGSRFLLMPNAVPILHQLLENNEYQTEKKNDVAAPEDEEVFENQSENISPNSSSTNNVMPPQLEEEPLIEIMPPQLEEEPLIEIIPPQLREEPLIKMPKEELMQVPIIKSISCAGTTQTNTRLCGLVEASDFADEFRLNCFYCSHVFPLEKWKSFVQHLNYKHVKEEAAFKVCEYVSEEHDYTPISVVTSPAESALETFAVIKKELRRSSLVDPLETPDNIFETVLLNSKFSYTSHENKTLSNHISVLNNIDKTKIYSKPTVLSRCLKRTNVEEMDIEDKKEDIPTSIEMLQLKHPTEITFEYTPREVVDLLLDNMKKYPILWKFDDKPFNEDIYEAAEALCKLVNEKFSLNIDNLKMRRSINRILRFYCYFFPNEDNEMNEEFSSYYNKCSLFLPTSRNEIAYARCSHCYICYRHDFDLQLHLFEEQKYLKWPFKCLQCKEVFRQHDEYEFHKHIPHYDEIFKCEPCNQTFFRRAVYRKHILDCHPNVRDEPGRYKCDICGKTYHSTSNLSAHKKTHGERKYKCRVCPKSFYTNGKLMLHSKIHRNEFDYVCEVCGLGCFSRAKLTMHLKKHTGEKVTCNICNLKLRKSSLSRHLRIVHVPYIGLVNPKPTRRHRFDRLFKSSLLRSGPRKRGEKLNYQCQICNISFENRKLRADHNKELHSDISKWACKMCTTHFSQRRDLQRHYRRKHKLHRIQAYKLVDENEDLNVVLALEDEDLDRLVKIPTVNKKKSDNATKSNDKTQTKSHLLPDEILFEVEKIHSSIIQDEIMQVADNIETQEMKVNNFNDFFTDLLNE